MYDKLLHGEKTPQQPGRGVISHNKAITKKLKFLSAENNSSLKGQGFHILSDFCFQIPVLTL